LFSRPSFRAQASRLNLQAFIDPIIGRKFSQRVAPPVQACLDVETDPERFLTAYRLDSRSFQGR